MSWKGPFYENFEEILIPINVSNYFLVSMSCKPAMELVDIPVPASFFPSWAALVIGPFKSETFENCLTAQFNIFHQQPASQPAEKYNLSFPSIVTVRAETVSSAFKVILGSFTTSDLPRELKENISALYSTVWFCWSPEVRKLIYWCSLNLIQWSE